MIYGTFDVDGMEKQRHRLVGGLSKVIATLYIHVFDTSLVREQAGVVVETTR